MLKRNASTIFWGLLWYSLIVFFKDYYFNLFYYMISDSKDADGNVVSLIVQSAMLILGAVFLRGRLIEKTEKRVCQHMTF